MPLQPDKLPTMTLLELAQSVSIPFKGKSIPAWLHLSPGYSGGKLPVVIAIPGMDSFKEASVALANDRWMARGVAVLAIDGPGQYESRARPPRYRARAGPLVATMYSRRGHPCRARTQTPDRVFLDEWRLQECAVTSARLQTKFVARESSTEETSGALSCNYRWVASEELQPSER